MAQINFEIKKKSETVCIIIPAYNEEKSIASVISSIRRLKRKYHIIVVNDGSTDNTRDVVERLGIDILNLPFNLGIGGAVQAGLRFAKEKKFDVAVQVDADGQHDPKYLPKLLSQLKGTDMVIGSRYLKKTKYKTPLTRLIVIRIFSKLIHMTCGKRIYDPTSGFRVFNKKVINFSSNKYPQEFPETLSIVTLLKNGYKIKEVPVEMRKRITGKSSFSWFYAIYMVFSTSISILLESVKLKRVNYE